MHTLRKDQVKREGEAAICKPGRQLFARPGNKSAGILILHTPQPPELGYLFLFPSFFPFSLFPSLSLLSFILSSLISFLPSLPPSPSLCPPTYLPSFSAFLLQKLRITDEIFCLPLCQEQRKYLKMCLHTDIIEAATNLIVHSVNIYKATTYSRH